MTQYKKTLSALFFGSALIGSTLLGASSAQADALVRAGTGNTKSKVKTFVNFFRDDIGGGLVPDANDSYGGLRREINWDFVPASSAAPNNIAADYFNTTNARGVVFETPGVAFQVSGKAPAPINFSNINAAYATNFAPFSGDRLFTSVDSNVVDVDFFVPGTTTPATVKGFGVVFNDVDVLGSATVEYFDASGESLGRYVAPVSEIDPLVGSGFSFLGVSFTTERVARVRITSGNTALGAAATDAPPASDLVVLDDIIFGEPTQAPPVAPITVVAPNGGESVKIGTSLAVTWNVSVPGGAVTIELTRNNGTTYETLVASTVDDGTENITVSGPPTAQALIRVRSLASGTAVDSSNGVFAITGDVPPTGAPTQIPGGATPTPIVIIATPTVPAGATVTPATTPGTGNAGVLSDLQASMTDAKITVRNQRSVITGSIVITNGGQAESGAFTVDVFAAAKKSVGAGATLIFRKNQASLAPGATVTVPFKYTIAGAKRSLFLETFADSGGTVIEINEGNNLGGLTAKVAKATGRPSK